ncbi:MAG TPA: hypothetical protein DDW84_04925 [Phycisphaerales bacterium]|jgi:hypothetical protein|nr:MAG: hypothetical protein A2Y13_09955 [Planctomycetes bacterium GWC2_45_44]HBG78179.1 hypothetical protein [Phycisphaerales bacterium]HBR18591.1 hypothetical protein [Phycisphaerales bacterium]
MFANLPENVKKRKTFFKVLFFIWSISVLEVMMQFRNGIADTQHIVVWDVKSSDAPGFVKRTGFLQPKPK